jgi:hypothetical protein
VHIIVIIYEISNVKVVLSKLVSKLIGAYFCDNIFFKFCIQLITKSMKASMVVHFYLQIFFIHFLIFMSKKLGRQISCLLYDVLAPRCFAKKLDLLEEIKIGNTTLLPK